MTKQAPDINRTMSDAFNALTTALGLRALAGRLAQTSFFRCADRHLP